MHPAPARPPSTTFRWADTPARYGLISRGFHWLMAALLIWQFLIIGLWQGVGDTPWVRAVTALGPFHVTIGLYTITLVTLRAAWAAAMRHRRPPGAPGWQGRAARLIHGSLYALMFTIPALGLLRAYGSGKGQVQWDHQLIPATGIEIPWMISLADAVHGEASWLMAVLILGHTGVAVIHGLKRDGVLRRMAGR
ncbi:cytochrome b [Tistrella mobilis]|uniref:cytochrome b n=1 Tax=Tistrella mobilis TaxID=171437 RepID=UPI00355785EC